MSQTWIDLQPDSVVDAAINQVRASDPQAWALFDGEFQPRYALWAYLVIGQAQDLPLPARMELIEALGGSAGLGAYAAGLSPYAATVSLAADGARSDGQRQRRVRPRGDFRYAGHGGWAVTGPGCEHRLAWVTAGLRRAALGVGLDLPDDYTRRVAADGLGLCDQLGVTRLGRGVVLHTAPDSNLQLPVVLGYADADGEWYRDGRRHASPPPSASVQQSVTVARR